MVMEFDMDKNYRFIHGGPSSDYDRAGGITINSNGDIIVNGTAQGNINGETHTSSCGSDLFVIKMDTSGNFIWTKLFGGCSGGGRS